MLPVSSESYRNKHLALAYESDANKPEQIFRLWWIKALKRGKYQKTYQHGYLPHSSPKENALQLSHCYCGVLFCVYLLDDSSVSVREGDPYQEVFR